MEAFAWLGDLVNFFGKFFPRLVIVRKTHEGVAFVRGHYLKRLPSGLHIYWPIVTEIQLYPVVRQTVNLDCQALITKCNITIGAGGILVYEVYDIAKALGQTWDLDDTIKDIAQLSLRTVVITKTLEELAQDRREIDLQLTKEAHHQLNEFGVKVIRFSISDLAKCLVIKNIGDRTNSYIPKLEDDESLWN